MRFSNLGISREKLCTSCDRWYAMSTVNFAPDVKAATGFSPRCRECAAEATRMWRKAFPAKAAQQRARNYKRLKQAGPDLTRQEKDELKAEANHSCFDCGKHETELARPLEYDHNLTLSKHGSNGKRNRQILCHGCNLKKGAKSTDFRPAKWKVAA
jgi:5-methylcytosine-specific restriction endonuclease McrA